MVVKTSSLWAVPAHITGIFQVVANENLLKMGSRGAGFSIDNTINTQIFYKKTSGKQVKIFYNKRKIDGKVTLEVANEFKQYWQDRGLIIKHFSELPIFAGYGTSAAGALGTAFALNELFNTNKSSEELAQIAHKAEVTCRTGLGDVIGQMNAKAEMRLEPGAPGIGVIKTLDWPKDMEVLTTTIGSISTKKILTDPKKVEEINNISTKLLKELREKPTLNEFLRVCYEFSYRIGLMSTKLKILINKLRELNYPACMIMLGESLFVVGKHNDLLKCATIIKTYYPKNMIWINSLAEKGPTKIS